MKIFLGSVSDFFTASSNDIQFIPSDLPASALSFPAGCESHDVKLAVNNIISSKGVIFITLFVS
jgi:hypothetical protein